MFCRLTLWSPLWLCEDVHKECLTDVRSICCGELDWSYNHDGMFWQIDSLSSNLRCCMKNFRQWLQESSTNLHCNETGRRWINPIFPGSCYAFQWILWKWKYQHLLTTDTCCNWTPALGQAYAMLFHNQARGSCYVQALTKRGWFCQKKARNYAEMYPKCFGLNFLSPLSIMASSYT